MDTLNNTAKSYDMKVNVKEGSKTGMDGVLLPGTCRMAEH